jgi:hypothetical protein
VGRDQGGGGDLRLQSGGRGGRSFLGLRGGLSYGGRWGRDYGGDRGGLQDGTRRGGGLGGGRAGRGLSGGRRSRRCGGGRWRGAYSSGGGENRSIVDQGAPEGRFGLRSQAGGLAKRAYVTSAAAPETAAAATFRVDGKTLTQEALMIHDIYEVGKDQTRARLEQELDYSTGS